WTLHLIFFFSSRRRHTRSKRDWSSDVCSSDLHLPIVVLIFNNHVLGMVRQWQTLFYEHRYSQTTIDRQTDYVKLAEAFGGKGLRIRTRHDIVSVMQEAMNSDVPCIVDCWIDKDDCVYPIIPPAKSAKDIIIGN